MATSVEAPTRTFVASAALEQFRRVHLDGNGKLEYCSAVHTDCVGTLSAPVFAADDLAAVRLHNAEGTKVFIAADDIAIGASAYAAANGKVSKAGTVLVGEALSVSAVDGDEIEICESASSILGNVARASLTEDALQPYPVKVRDLYVWDALGTNPITTPAGNDDLALVYNTFGTAAPTLETADAKASTKTQKIGFQLVLPVEYVAAGDVKLRINAGMKTTVSDGTATVDVNAYRQDAPTVDICATAAQSINSLTPANKDFVLTATDLTAGQVIDVVVTVAVTDSATGTAVIGQINKLIALLDIKG